MFVGAFSCSVVPGIFGNQLNYCVDVINQMLVQALGCQHKEVDTSWCHMAVLCGVTWVHFIKDHMMSHDLLGVNVLP